MYPGFITNYLCLTLSMKQSLTTLTHDYCLDQRGTYESRLILALKYNPNPHINTEQGGKKRKITPVMVKLRCCSE